MAVSALAAMVGFRARTAAGIWAVLAVWTLGIPNLYGKVDHYHHLVWFAVLLASSPCADALSLDRARRRAPNPTVHVRYGFLNRPGFDGGSGYWIPTPAGSVCWAA